LTQKFSLETLEGFSFLKLAPRGKLSIGALVGLGVSALLFNDRILLLIFIGLYILVLSEFAWMTIVLWRPNRFFILSSLTTNEPLEGSKGAERKLEVTRKSIALGEPTSQDFSLTLRARSYVTLSSNVPYLKLTPREFKNNVRKSRIQFEFRSPLAGIYPVEKINVSFRSPLSFFESNSYLDIPLQYSVYPRVYDIALTSSKILGKSGIGEIPTDFPGIGTEFYDMREYQSGDDIRKVNWKASARLGELFVNDHAREVGASYYLVLESNATSDFDRDRLASAFLQIANLLSLQGANFGIVVHDGKKVTLFKEIDRPLNSLAFALDAALDFAQVSKEQLTEELAPPLPSHKIRAIRETLSKQGLALLSEIERIAQSQMISSIERNDPIKTIIDKVKENYSEPPATIYVGGLSSSSSIAPIIEASAELKRAFNADFIVIDPTAPWVVAQDEVQAAEIYETYLNKLRVLDNSHVQYRVGDPLKVAEQLFI
jgi:uncharacterized protein (DUF58 family)